MTSTDAVVTDYDAECWNVMNQADLVKILIAII